jgi:hypothetical protein
MADEPKTGAVSSNVFSRFASCGGQRVGVSRQPANNFFFFAREQ